MEPVAPVSAIRIHRGAMPRQKNQRCLAILLMVLVSNPGLSAEVATSPINQTQVIDFLNETINWYQQIAVGQPESPSPNDILFAASNAPLADQVVKLSFDFGRAGADLLGQTTSGLFPRLLSTLDIYHWRHPRPRLTFNQTKPNRN